MLAESYFICGWVRVGRGVDLENKKVACSKLIWLNEMGTIKNKNFNIMCTDNITYNSGCYMYAKPDQQGGELHHANENNHLPWNTTNNHLSRKINVSRKTNKNKK